jgi:hypothetical protein
VNVKQLRDMLLHYPDDMEIITDRCSDYDIIKEDEWSIVKAVPKDFGYMRSHKTMSDENKKEEKYYLHLEGN